MAIAANAAPCTPQFKAAIVRCTTGPPADEPAPLDEQGRGDRPASETEHRQQVEAGRHAAAPCDLERGDDDREQSARHAAEQARRGREQQPPDANAARPDREHERVVASGAPGLLQVPQAVATHGQSASCCARNARRAALGSLSACGGSAMGDICVGARRVSRPKKSAVRVRGCPVWQRSRRIPGAAC